MWRCVLNCTVGRLGWIVGIAVALFLIYFIAVIASGGAALVAAAAAAKFAGFILVLALIVQIIDCIFFRCRSQG